MTRHRLTVVAVLASIAGTVAAQCPSQAAACSSPETQPQARIVAAAHSNLAGNIVETAKSAGSFNTLLAAAQAAGLAEALTGDGPFTVFAPTDDAFAALPKGTVDTLLKPENKAALAAILKYHVLPGVMPASDVTRLSGSSTLNGQRVSFKTADGRVSIDGATVIKADVACTNGVIHVIDRVIMPESANIVEITAKAGSFNTLLAAAKAAGLAEALAGEGPYTVLAPTDEAFAKLPKGTVESLLKPENKAKLASILKYHVIAGRIPAASAVAAGSADTLEGRPVAFEIADGRLRVQGAAVVATDIDASNGVVHVIDTVLLPSEPERHARPQPSIEKE